MNKEQIIEAFIQCYGYSDSDPCTSCPFELMGENCCNLGRDVAIILKELVEENKIIKINTVQKMTDMLKKRLPVISPSIFNQIAEVVLEEKQEEDLKDENISIT